MDTHCSRVVVREILPAALWFRLKPILESSRSVSGKRNVRPRVAKFTVDLYGRTSRFEVQYAHTAQMQVLCGWRVLNPPASHSDADVGGGEAVLAYREASHG